MLKEGENTLCVSFHNKTGGAIFDLSLLAAYGKPDTVDEDGYIIINRVTTEGFVNFGAINAPENVLDFDETTCTGSDYNGGREQSVTLWFAGEEYISEIFVQCKEEGNTTNEDETRGTYKIVTYCDGYENDLGTIPAVTGTNGGYSLLLDTPVKADSVKIQIVSWQGDCWACVADAYVKAAESAPDDPTETPTETPSETPTETPTETPSETPTESPIETPTDTPSETPIETPTETSTETPVETSAETSTVQPTTTPSESTPTPAESKTTETTKSDDEGSGKTLPIILIACGCVIAAAVVVFIVIKKKKK